MSLLVSKNISRTHQLLNLLLGLWEKQHGCALKHWNHVGVFSFVNGKCFWQHRLNPTQFSYVSCLCVNVEDLVAGKRIYLTASTATEHINKLWQNEGKQLLNLYILFTSLKVSVVFKAWFLLLSYWLNQFHSLHYLLSRTVAMVTTAIGQLVASWHCPLPEPHVCCRVSTGIPPSVDLFVVPSAHCCRTFTGNYVMHCG